MRCVVQDQYMSFKYVKRYVNAKVQMAGLSGLRFDENSLSIKVAKTVKGVKILKQFACFPEGLNANPLGDVKLDYKIDPSMAHWRMLKKLPFSDVELATNRGVFFLQHVYNTWCSGEFSQWFSREFCEAAFSFEENKEIAKVVIDQPTRTTDSSRTTDTLAHTDRTPVFIPSSEHTLGGLVSSDGEMLLVPVSAESVCRNKRKAEGDYVRDFKKPAVKQYFTQAEDVCVPNNSHVPPQLQLAQTFTQNTEEISPPCKKIKGIQTEYSCSKKELHSVKLDYEIELPSGCFTETGEIFLLPMSMDNSKICKDFQVCSFAPPPQWFPTDEIQYVTVRKLTHFKVRVPSYSRRGYRMKQ
eukprot:GHVR01155756.1.p1 GENE.GHVR01155756.1~~GHVR01155756.1.p1  ORF type:complete len:355 (+),score=24.20 GHVR01155756.1:49-1113(+)